MKYPEFPDHPELQAIVDRAKIHFTVYVTFEEQKAIIGHFGGRLPEPLRYVGWEFDHDDHFRFGFTRGFRPSEVRSALHAVAYKMAGDAVARKLANV